jgi:hypothetical protein
VEYLLCKHKALNSTPGATHTHTHTHNLFDQIVVKVVPFHLMQLQECSGKRGFVRVHGLLARLLGSVLLSKQEWGQGEF